MSGDLIPFNFKDKGQIRAILKDGKQWFLSADATRMLGYTNGPKAIADHTKEHERADITIRSVSSNGVEQDRKVGVILLSGLLRLVLRSKMPEAEEFQTWVVGDVVPSIMSTGAYIAPGANLVVQSTPEAIAAAIVKMRDDAVDACRQEYAQVIRDVEAQAERDAVSVQAVTNITSTEMEEIGRMLIAKAGTWRDGCLISGIKDAAPEWTGSHTTQKSIEIAKVGLGIGFMRWSQYLDFLDRAGWLERGQVRHGERDAGTRQVELTLDDVVRVEWLLKGGYVDRTASAIEACLVTPKGRGLLEARLGLVRAKYANGLRGPVECSLIRGMICGQLHAGELPDLMQGFLHNQAPTSKRFTWRDPEQPRLH
jgi:prophage antirepressor-like protein